jgi:hypothetical protein
MGVHWVNRLSSEYYQSYTYLLSYKTSLILAWLSVSDVFVSAIHSLQRQRLLAQKNLRCVMQSMTRVQPHLVSRRLRVDTIFGRIDAVKCYCSHAVCPSVTPLLR